MPLTQSTHNFILKQSKNIFIDRRKNSDVLLMRKSMGGWQIPNDGGAGLGWDEVQICRFCVQCSLGMIISENVVVGHLSFGKQNEAMKEYYLTRREKFRCPSMKR